MERRLAAILAADVVGYTRLMGADEAGTLHRLTELREVVLQPLIDEYRGRIVKLMGDGMLVEFASAVDALDCASAWQDRVGENDAVTDIKKRLRYRIGINVGDVIVDSGDLHGDGVNIASRLESLAEPGGICLSSDAFRQVRGKTEAEFEDLGQRRVKNVEEPLHVYRVLRQVAEHTASATSAGETLEVDLSLPDYPSIAVLPFTAMSGDADQEFFADGITEDIITALSKIGNLLVVSRASTFTYKGKVVGAKQVSKEQGVRYILEGSVRRANNRVRINTQLIDANSGMHLWAERYDRELEDIFAVQDEITREVAVALEVRLSAGKQAQFWSSGTGNLEAWECVRWGMELANGGNPESVRESQQQFERAIELDPTYAMAHVGLGWFHHHSADISVANMSKADRKPALVRAMECADKALKLDSNCADAYPLAGFCHLANGDHDAASAVSEKAVELAPGNAEILGLAAMIQLKSGRPAQALELIKKAMRRCPVYPAWFCLPLATAYRLLGRSDVAVNIYETAIERNAEFLPLHVGLASTLGELGRQQDARKSVSEILRLDPLFSIEKYTGDLSYSDPAITERIGDGLRKVSLPS